MEKHLPSLAVAQRLLSYTLRAGGPRPSLPAAHAALRLSSYSLLMSPAALPGWDTIRFSIVSKEPRFNSAQGSEKHRPPSQPEFQPNTAASQGTWTVSAEEPLLQYAACILPSALFWTLPIPAQLPASQNKTKEQEKCDQKTP